MLQKCIDDSYMYIKILSFYYNILFELVKVSINIDTSLFANRTNSFHLSTTSNENNEKNKKVAILEYQEGTKPILT